MEGENASTVPFEESTATSSRRLRWSTIAIAGPNIPRSPGARPVLASRYWPYPLTTIRRQSVQLEDTQRSYELCSPSRDSPTRPWTQNIPRHTARQPLNEPSSETTQHSLRRHGDKIESKSVEGAVSRDESSQTRSISSAVQSFLNEVRFGDLVACARFINSNLIILSEGGQAINELVSTAEDCIREHDLAQAKSCAEKALILRMCRGMSAIEMTAFFRLLHIQDAKRMEDFNRKFDDILTGLHQSAGDGSNSDADRASRFLKAQTIGASSMSPLETVQMPKLVPAQSSVDMWTPTTNRRAQDATMPPLPEADTPKDTTATLDRRYSVRESSFYKVGKVFAVLWHENYSRIPATSASLREKWTKPESIYKPVRRMVVVRAEKGFSVCIQINTYGDRGLHKFKEDKTPNTHGVIYTTDRLRPEQQQHQPPLIKKPIHVVPSQGMADEFEQTSSIDFGRFHTIEHNVVAMDLGCVSKDSMPCFDSCWKRELLKWIDMPSMLNPAKAQASRSENTDQKSTLSL